MLGRETVPARIIHVPSMLKAEEAENEVRKDFTPMERAAIGRAIEKEIGNRQGQRTDLGGGSELGQNFAEVSGRKSSEIAAEKAGFGNPETYRQAKTVADRGEPELQDAVDRGDLSISAAAKLAKEPPEDQRAAAAASKTERKQQRKREREERQAKAAEAGKQVPRESGLVSLRHCECLELMEQLEPESVDWIITDPPYPYEYLHTFDDLARLAEHALKPGGLLLAMSGQSFLPEVIARLSQRLVYHWTLAYMLPGGQATQVFPRRAMANWKPVLAYSCGEYEGRWFVDVAKSDVNDNQKDDHHWGQSVSGMSDLVARFVNEGDVVLDPFMGAGTTALAVIAQDAQFIGADVDEKFVDIAASRIFAPEAD